MTDTARLGLPLIDGAQAQKHVTHNEALALLDVVVQARVLDRTRTAPPTAPADGDAHLVAAGATGAWAGADGRIAARRDGAWHFLAPATGWLVWVAAENRLIVKTDAGWLDVVADLATPPTALDNLTRLGIGTGADATNPFAAKLNTALFAARAVAEGGSGDLRLTFNKENAAATSSLVFQSGWSGRAEIGLAGSDALAFKVSDDGATWRTALAVTPATGAIASRDLMPATDNAHTLGSASRRWSQIYAATATISTSDAATKTEIAADVPGLGFVRRLRPVTYRQAAGGRRRHCGLIAQEVAAALDGRDLALWTHDAETTLEGLRYEELVPVLIQAVQDLADRLDRLDGGAA
jgi:hypothetical protein